MTSYWKPRWPNRVLFGSYRDLNYRLDLLTRGETCFRLRTQAGPGFSLELVRADRPPGYAVKGEIPEPARKRWLSDPSRARDIASLLELHFSRLLCRPCSIELFCCPEQDDLLPEGPQLAWCLSLVHQLLAAVPVAERQALSRSEFIGGGDRGGEGA